MAKKRATTPKPTAATREPTEAEYRRALEILQKRQPPDTESLHGQIKREAGRTKPRRRGARVIPGRGRQPRSI